jgi:hypothetical protein
MTVVNSEREVGYSVMEYSSCASRGIGDVASRSTQREGCFSGGDPFSASQARQRSMGGGRFRHGVIRLRLVFRFAVMIVFV